MFDCYDTAHAVLQVTTGVMSTLKVRFKSLSSFSWTLQWIANHLITLLNILQYMQIAIKNKVRADCLKMFPHDCTACSGRLSSNVHININKGCFLCLCLFLNTAFKRQNVNDMCLVCLLCFRLTRVWWKQPSVLTCWPLTWPTILWERGWVVFLYIFPFQMQILRKCSKSQSSVNIILY